MILKRGFFERPVLKVAPDLLGKILVRKWRGREIRGLITEVEAYDGPRDKASHASRGMTERNKIMFGEAGYFYVYFTYGMHWMLNIVTGEEGYPAAVLIRGIYEAEPRKINLWKSDFHRLKSDFLRLLDGPGRVTKFLHIDKKLNGKLACRASGLWIEDVGTKFLIKVERTPRIGVQYAGEWAGKPYRFLLRKNPQ